MSASATRAYAAALRLGTCWLHLYTRSVDPRIAADRETEAMFEFWENALAVDRAHWSGPRAAGTLAVRIAAEMPRDLVWRHAATRGWGTAAIAPIRLISNRRRIHYWVPLQQGHVFDQTNGMIEPEKAMAYERGAGSIGAAGNAFGIQGGF